MPERDEAKPEVEEAIEAPAEGGSEPEAAAVEAEVVGQTHEVEVIEPEPTEEDKLRAQLEQTQGRLRSVSKAYTDLQGEMAAFRERTEHLGKMKAERASFDAVSAFFDPVQNLKRSLGAGAQDLESLRQGVEMVLNQFNDAMRKLGLVEVPGIGAPFDPKMHEALAVSPVTDAAQDGRVLMVHQGGYTLNGKVLQASQVVIGKFEEPAEA